MPHRKVYLDRFGFRRYNCEWPLPRLGNRYLRSTSGEPTGYPADTVPTTREFTDREAAADWIDSNQISRRNLTPDQMSFIRGRRNNRLKKSPTGRADRDFSDCQNVSPKPSTAKSLADQYGVSERTILRDGADAALLDTDPELAAAVIWGEVKSQKYAEGYLYLLRAAPGQLRITAATGDSGAAVVVLRIQIY